MKVKNFFRTKWQYILVFMIPWILVVIHSIFREAWPLGGGSILVKDAGNLYVQLYSELWEKVHNGGSLAFSWSSGLGVDFVANMFRYLMSPCTILILLTPKAWIANMVQLFMVLKWSLLSVSMLYYVSHTKHNTLEHRKTLVSIVLAMAYFLGNAVISVLDNLAGLDVMILFPVLLLLEERMAEQKNYKLFYVLFALCILMNYTLAIPMAIFLIVWYILQFDENTPCTRKSVFSYVCVYVAAVVTGMLVMIPCVMSGVGVVSKGKTSILSFGELLQRFFVCDSLSVVQEEQPMLYCSVAVVVLALLYAFTKGSLKKKICVCGLTLLLLVGLLTRTGSLVWNGILEVSGEFAFLLTFIVMFMAMETMNRLETLKMWQVIVAGVVAVAGVVYGFFSATIMLDFYVYLATILIVVFVILMLVFYCKKSILYKNVLVVFAIVGLLELVSNAYYHMQVYNEYTVDNLYQHKNAGNLSANLMVEDGEKVAMTQVMYNYGMTLQVPGTASTHDVATSNVGELYKALGMEWSEDASGMFGGSPLLNLMFNVRYGFGQSEIALSDCEKIKSTSEYNLYEMKRLAGLGYMVDTKVTDWNVEASSPFDMQNDFVEKSTGEGAIFEVITPEMSCSSLLGYDVDAEHHHHEDGEVCEEEHDQDSVYHGEYMDNGVYYYSFEKMYSEDYVVNTFTSDGVSDYYIYLSGSAPSVTHVQINDEYVYWDQIASEQKTLHIGVVPEGQTISVLSDFKVDDLAFGEIRYQVAAFQEESYSKAYDVLCANTLQLTSMEDDSIKGTIAVDTNGIMMTSIPAMEGMSVMVDGKEVEYEVIGNALIGVPLSAGEHEIEVSYASPYLSKGVTAFLLGLLVFACYAAGQAYMNKKNKMIEGQQ